MRSESSPLVFSDCPEAPGDAGGLQSVLVHLSGLQYLLSLRTSAENPQQGATITVCVNQEGHDLQVSTVL